MLTDGEVGSIRAKYEGAVQGQIEALCNDLLVARSALREIVKIMDQEQGHTKHMRWVHSHLRYARNIAARAVGMEF